MAIRYDFLAADGSVYIPINQTQVFTGDMSADFENGQCVIAFYDGVDGAIVAPTAGTATFYSSPIEGQYLASPDGVINAADVGDESYTPVTFSGPVVQSKLVIAGVDVATHYRAFHWRH